jgi:hypothetical protein
VRQLEGSRVNGRRIGEANVVSEVRRLKKIPREDMQLFKGRVGEDIERGRRDRKEEGGETEMKREERQKGRGRI